MKPILDPAFRSNDAADFDRATADHLRPAARPVYSDFPYARPRRRMHPMLAAFFAFGTASGAFYGAEMLAPPTWRPSAIIGGYEQAMAEARKSGELTAQLRYEGQLKQIETAAVQWQEQYKAAANGVLNYYQATYSRAGVYAQATADIQKQYAATRYQIASTTTGGQTTLANLASLIGNALNAYDPSMGQGALDFAQQMREQAYSVLDDAARSGITVSVDGWNSGLASPAEVASAIRDLPPLKLPSFDPDPNSNQRALPAAVPLSKAR